MATNTTGASTSTATFAMAGSYSIIVNVSNSSTNSSASTPVTVNQTLATIAVAPPTPMILINGTQQFTASGKDQFNAVMLSPPAFTWSVSAGLGSINSTGLFTAAPTAGQATINAANGGASGSAVVTVMTNPITPPLTWSAPANITYGTALSSTQLNASTNVPGSFAYTPSFGTILNAGGNQTLSVIFTPQDTVNYTSASASVLITVSPAMAIITLSNLHQAYDGTPKTSTVSTTPPNISTTLLYNGSATAPSNAGSYPVTATITDPNYLGSANGILIIDQTTVTSATNATPNPAGVLKAVAFSVAAANSNNDPLSFTWDFGDGLQGTGSSVMHSFAHPGIYHVVVSIDNGLMPVTNAVDVTVNASVALIGEGADSDGDGYSDSFEMFAGTDPTSAASTPTGQPATMVSVGNLTISKAQIKLNFAKAGNDSILFSGLLGIPLGFNPLANDVLVDVGGVLKKMALAHNGSAHVGGDVFKVSIKTKKGVVQPNAAAHFTATFKKGSFASVLANTSQLSNGNVSSSARMVTFVLLFNGTALKKQQGMVYTATNNKSGTAK